MLNWEKEQEHRASVCLGRKRGLLVCLKSGHITEAAAFSLKRNTRNFGILSIIIPKSSALDPMSI